MEKIPIRAFAAVDLRIGTVVDAKPHPNADRLLVLKVRIDDEDRQIVAGIRQYYTPEQLVGKQIAVVANLEPVELRGVESCGMVLAAKDSVGNLALLHPDKAVEPGATIR